jgi:hypothetical protein
METFFNHKLLEEKEEEGMNDNESYRKIWGGNKHPPPKYKIGPTLDI